MDILKSMGEDPEKWLSDDGLEGYRKGLVLVDPDLVLRVLSFQGWLGEELILNDRGLGLSNRGFRSWREHESLYRGREAPRFSQHLFGMSQDMHVAGRSGPWLSAKALEWSKERAEACGGLVEVGFTGVGEYETFVHVDVRRPTRNRIARWKG